MEVGEIYQHKGKIVVVTSISPNATTDDGLDGGYSFWVQQYFPDKPGTGLYPTNPDELSPIDEDVGKFLSLIGHASQMTHDELKEQIRKLFTR